MESGRVKLQLSSDRLGFIVNIGLLALIDWLIGLFAIITILLWATNSIWMSQKACNFSYYGVRTSPPMGCLAWWMSRHSILGPLATIAAASPYLLSPPLHLCCAALFSNTAAESTRRRRSCKALLHFKKNGKHFPTFRVCVFADFLFSGSSAALFENSTAE